MKAIFLFLFCLFSLSSEKTKEEWKSRSIYQLLTDRFAIGDGSKPSCDLSKYCGGNFRGIINNLDYIKGMGFDAIWISPVVENTEGSYHGYHMTKIYNINQHFGTASDLKALVSACHEKGIWVMADVVANHVGPVGFDYSGIDPFNSSEYYHDYCEITDWDDQYQVENCRLSGLPDLKQENEYVTEQLLKWIKWLVNEYNFDGLRVDTIIEVPKSFWAKFTPASGVFTLGEGFNGKAAYIGGYQGYLDGVLNYALYFKLQSSFCGSMWNLEKYIKEDRDAFPDPDLLGIFVENHDNKRFLNTCNDRKKFKNALIFALLYEGIPVFYYGGEQWFNGGDDPKNREPMWDHFDTSSEMYKALAVANKVRKEKEIWNKKLVQRYADDVFYCYSRGDVLVAVTRGEGCQRQITYHEYSEGDKLCNAFDSSDCVTVNGGAIDIQMGTDPKIYVLQKQIIN
ncbi:MAG: alpha-amylase family glycosyl hydrolase [archaeon]|nr:alpha-amylase family glycosyl hydrolase [archaeon]